MVGNEQIKKIVIEGLDKHFSTHFSNHFSNHFVDTTFFQTYAGRSTSESWENFPMFGKGWKMKFFRPLFRRFFFQP